MPGFPRQADHKGAVHLDAQFFAPLDHAAAQVQGDALADVFQDLGVAGFEAHHQQPEPPFLHGLQGLVRGVGPGGGGPEEFQVAEFPAQLAGPLAVGGEGVVVEEDLGGLGEELQAAAHFGHHVGHAADPEAVAGEGLGPEAVDAMARAAPAGIKGDVGVAQIGDLGSFPSSGPGGRSR